MYYSFFFSSSDFSSDGFVSLVDSSVAFFLSLLSTLSFESLPGTVTSLLADSSDFLESSAFDLSAESLEDSASLSFDLASLRIERSRELQ